MTFSKEKNLIFDNNKNSIFVVLSDTNIVKENINFNDFLFHIKNILLNKVFI